MPLSHPGVSDLRSEAVVQVQQPLEAIAPGDILPMKHHIALAPASTADNEGTVNRLTELINTVYAAGEAAFWRPSFVRTNPDEVRQFLAAGELALAWRPGSSPVSSGPADITGCVRAHLLDARTGEFGLLACDPAFRGSGVGRDLLRFAEDIVRSRGAEVMHLELLVGDGWTHELKERLGLWYERVGYQLIRTGSIEESFPRLGPMLAQPARFRIYEKAL